MLFVVSRIPRCLRLAGPAALVALASTALAQAPTAPASSLYQRIGGTPTLKAVVDDFVATAAPDPKVDFTRGGAWTASDVAVTRLKKQLVDFMAQALGGPQEYRGRSMKAAHSGMAITRAQFDALAGHLKAALVKNKLAPADVDAIMKIAASTAPDIVERP
jgi:hemoglobin